MERIIVDSIPSKMEIVKRIQRVRMAAGMAVRVLLIAMARQEIRVETEVEALWKMKRGLCRSMWILFFGLGGPWCSNHLTCFWWESEALTFWPFVFLPSLACTTGTHIGICESFGGNFGFESFDPVSKLSIHGFSLILSGWRQWFLLRRRYKIP